MTWVSAFYVVTGIAIAGAILAYAISRLTEEIADATSKDELLHRHLAQACEGFDDPDERCPRRPEDCVCWKVRQSAEVKP